jgi:glycosyltransferase involved in cell wall biosynthesis
LCPYPIGVAAGQRLKYEQYFSDWESLGYQIEVSCFFDLRTWQVLYRPGRYFDKLSGLVRGQLRRFKDFFRVSDFDLVYIFMWATPFGPSISERIVRKRAKRVVYDIEDNIFLSKTNVMNKSNPNRWAVLLKSSSKAIFLVKTADHVITSSPFLNTLCLDLNLKDKCTYVSSSVDTNRFIPVNTYSNNRRVVIGWTGTFSSKRYLDTLREVFLQLTERVGFRLKIIGNFDFELPGIDLEVVRWTSQTEIQDLQSIDIGVYPLPLDDWVQGKSGLKAIQYMAFGLPTVASRAGNTPLLISHEVDGLLVESPEEWVDSLEGLIRDPALRRRLGQAARIKAVQTYSVNVVKNDYRKILESVVEE